MPSPAKIEKVAQIKQLFTESQAIFVADYQGLSVADETVLRRNLRENNVTFLVAKNTLLKRAAEQAGVSEIQNYFVGPTAVAFTAEDAAVAAKILYDSYKSKELPRTKVFIVDGEVHDGSEIARLAELPPREILLSSLVAAVEAPLAELVRTIDAV